MEDCWRSWQSNLAPAFSPWGGVYPLSQGEPEGGDARWVIAWCQKKSCEMQKENLRCSCLCLISLYSVFLLPRHGVVAPMWGWPTLELCKGCKPKICILDYFSVLCWAEHAVHMIKVVDEGITDVYVDIPDLDKVLSNVLCDQAWWLLDFDALSPGKGLANIICSRLTKNMITWF